MKRLIFACGVLLTIGLLTGCEKEPKENNKGNNETVETTFALTKSTSKSRVKLVKPSKVLPKRHRLELVGTIDVPTDRKELMWSATSVAVRPNNTIDDNFVYVTWHSNYQANNPATQWGGAIDIVNMKNGELTGYINAKKGMKFNHVLYSKNRLFLSTTSSECGAAIGRAMLNAEGTEIMSETSVDRIGFPGSSVNAIAEYGNEMVAISGHKGTYATFNPEMEPALYNYMNASKNEIEPKTDLFNFGGKYALAANGTTYILYDNGNGAIIESMDGATKIETGVRLVSTINPDGNKFAELYDEKTGEWVLIGDGADYYGKHTLAVTEKYAYVACGANGLLGVNLSTGDKVFSNNVMAIGLCAGNINDKDYIFASTAMGLRIYQVLENGDLDLYAFEVENYDENTGLPTSDQPATIETSLRHSPNFVTYDAATGYIYVAYGQTGVRVYRFRTDENPNPTPTDEGVDMGGDILWATENLDGYYAWGEIFNNEDPSGKTFTHKGVTYTNDGTYYPNGTNKTSYADFTNYRFFNNSTKLTKYTWMKGSTAISEDGKTVLESMDDAAAVRLGNGWRMPTADEWKELLFSCTVEETTQDGKAGILLTAKNGKKIFLPQTGFYNSDNELVNKTQFYYWSSSLSEQITRNGDTRENLTGGFINGGSVNPRQWSNEALASGFNGYYMPEYEDIWVEMTMDGQLNGFTRCYGMAIRPVKDK